MTEAADILFKPYEDTGAGIEWLEETFIPQSMIFYAQLMPVVYQCALSIRGAEPLKIADIGAAHGAGSNFIHNMLNNLLGVASEITAFEMQPRYKRYADAKFPAIRFKTVDFFDDADRYDMVVSSHTLEHMADPRAFVSRVMDRVHCAVFYVLYREQKLIPGHVVSFDDELILSMPGFVWGRVFKSVGWRTEQDARVAAFVCAKPLDPDAAKKLAETLDSEFAGSPVIRRGLADRLAAFMPRALRRTA